MKSFKSLMFAALTFVALAAPSFAASPAQTFAATGTAIAGTNSHVIISGRGAGIAEIDHLSVTSDKATSYALFYTAGSGLTATLGTNASQAVHYFPGTGNFAANDKVVLWHAASDTFERLVVSAVAATTVTFTANPTAASVAGDVLYKMTAGAMIPVGAATLTVAAPCYRGQKGLPIYLEVDGTSACKINAVSGRYRTYAQNP
jgi:hypothetical protein